MATNKDIQKKLGVTADGIIGPKTYKAMFEALGMQNPVSSASRENIKAVQKRVGVVVDGIWGPKTAEAVMQALTGFTQKTSSKKKIFIDPGHTADRAREYPSTFTKVNWNSGKFAEVAEQLGFTSNQKDSVEHMLNAAIAKRLKVILEAKGMEVVYYDDPSLSNNAEITNVYTKSNAARPDAFVSIHNNAVGSKGWEAMSCSAAGSVALYYASRTEGKKLATTVAKKLEAYRKDHGGPDNRKGNIVNTSSVAVLSKASSSIPATLVEVCFYDNIDDLLFTVKHLDGIAGAIADGVASYLA